VFFNKNFPIMKPLTNIPVTKGLLSLSLILFTIISCRKDAKIISNIKNIAEASVKSEGHSYGTVTSEMVLNWNEAGTQAIANMTPLTGSGSYSTHARIKDICHGQRGYARCFKQYCTEVSNYALNNARDKDA
jgi:hypothetical protein